jgi:hypothetical protein
MSNVWSEYVAGLIESLADSITTLKVIEIPQAVSHQYMGFLELPGEFCLNLQPGDAKKVNFNVEESESHTGWHACVMDSLPITPPKAVIIHLEGARSEHPSSLYSPSFIFIAIDMDVALGRE